MRALWHPTRAAILEFLCSGPARRSQLIEATGAPHAEVAYHCRSLCRCRCIVPAAGTDPDAEDPAYEKA
jgi:hypothetical protein